MTSMRPFAWLCAALLLVGCAELLPKSRAETHAEWPSFETVRAAIEQIEPYKTTKAELKARGIGAPGDPTITLLSHVDIAIRFPIGGVLREEDVDLGIRDCMKAGKACSGYLVNMRRIKRDRIGNFWADAFAFRRETDVTGWTFNALIIFVDEVAVYAVYGGQPTLHETEVDRNPLGPLQGWGDGRRRAFFARRDSRTRPFGSHVRSSRSDESVSLGAARRSTEIQVQRHSP